MTTPAERTRSVLYAKSFLEDLLDPKKTPRVPKSIRAQAYRILRHYPTRFDMETVAEILQPNPLSYKVFGNPQDPI